MGRPMLTVRVGCALPAATGAGGACTGAAAFDAAAGPAAAAVKEAAGLPPKGLAGPSPDDRAEGLLWRMRAASAACAGPVGGSRIERSTGLPGSPPPAELLCCCRWCTSLASSTRSCLARAPKSGRALGAMAQQARISATYCSQAAGGRGAGEQVHGAAAGAR